jgi:hypothetical protein
MRGPDDDKLLRFYNTCNGQLGLEPTFQNEMKSEVHQKQIIIVSRTMQLRYKLKLQNK